MATLSKEKVREIIQNAPPGTNPEEIVRGLVARGHTLEGYTPEKGQKPDGFLVSLAKGVVKPFVTAGVTAASATQGASNLLVGGLAKAIGADTFAEKRFAEANRVTKEGYNVPGFGQMKPVGSTIGTEKGAYKNEVKRMLGTGGEIAGTIGAGSAASVVGKGVVKGALLQAAKAGAIEGGLAGAASGFGQGVQKENVSAGSLAADTALGGVLGAATGAVVPAVAGLVKGAIRTVNPGVKVLLKSAVKPTGQAAKTFDASLDKALPALEKYATQVKDLRSLDTAIRAAKAETWDVIQSGLAGAEKEGALVDGNKIGEAIRSAMNNKKIQREAPDLLTKLEAKAKAYEGQKLSPVEAEDILEATNASMQSYFNKNKVSQALAEKADPEIAAEVKLAASIREELDRIVSLSDTKGFGELKKVYGALSQLGSHVSNRIPIAERANMTSLAEQISAARTAGNVAVNLATLNPGQAVASLGDYATARILKTLESSDSKVSRAFSMFQKQLKKTAKKPVK